VAGLLLLTLAWDGRAQDKAADKPAPTVEELGKPKRPQEVAAGPDEMYIDFDGVPLQDVIRAISAQTGRNFDYDPNLVSQKVTIVAHHPVPQKLALDILETILAAPPRNLQILKTLDGNLYRIVPRTQQQGADKMPITSGKGEPLDGFDRIAIHVVKVEYADITKVAELVKKVGSELADITAYAQSNLLILKDSADGIRNMLSLLKVIDVPGTGTGVEIFPLQWTRAETLSKQVTEVLLGETAPGPGQAAAPAIVRRQPRVDPGTGQPVTEIIGQDEQVLRVVADERLNALIVVASEAMMEQVRFLVNQLDTANDPDTNNIHYRSLLNADGEEVAEALEAIIGGSTPAKAGGGGGGGGAPGGAQDGSVHAFEREVVVSFYKQTNSLLILASPQDYKLIDDIVTQLDVPRRQVSVESVIMEVTVNDKAALGVEGALLNNDNVFALSNTINIANILTGGTGLASLAGAGASIGILDGTTDLEIGGETITVPNVPFLLRALETVTDVDVLSRPNLMIVDNVEKEAEITVGNEIPLPTSQADVNPQSGFQTRNSIERRKTGVTLKIKAQIREGDYVSLSVYVEVSSPVESTVGIDPNETGATLALSQLSTEVVLADGKTGIIGGLLRESLSHTTNQVPGLGDVPILGFLFRSKGSGRSKQNLVILLTPHVLRRAEDVQRLTEYQMKQFSDANLDAIFEKGYIKKLKAKHDQRKTGPVRRDEASAETAGGFDRGRLRN
jgi:general secretion pathway protein D